MAKFYIDSSGTEKVINLSNVQRMLGVYEFITGQGYDICCKSIDLCLIQKLPFDTFMAIVNQLKIWVPIAPPRKSSRNCSIKSYSIATCKSSINCACSAWKVMLKRIVQNCMLGSVLERICWLMSTCRGRTREWGGRGGD